MKFYFTFITLFLSIVSISQSEVDYLNNYLEETSEKLAVYKRNFTEVEEGIFRAEITYFNGTLKAVGSYVLIDDELVPHGQFSFYYENGVKESEGIFVKGYKSGEWLRFMKDGTELKPRFYEPSLGNIVEELKRD